MHVYPRGIGSHEEGDCIVWDMGGRSHKGIMVGCSQQPPHYFKQKFTAPTRVQYAVTSLSSCCPWAVSWRSDAEP